MSQPHHQAAMPTIYSDPDPPLPAHTWVSEEAQAHEPCQKTCASMGLKLRGRA